MSGATSRRKGHDAEREYAGIYREELGYKQCITSREGSYLYDKCGIDLVFVDDHLVQIKAGEYKILTTKTGDGIRKELQKIRDKVLIHFPPNSIEEVLPRILIHKKPVKVKKLGRQEKDDLVYVYENELLELLNTRNKKFVIPGIHMILKKDKDGLLCLTFYKFKKLLLNDY